jgi:predicted acyl esterase
MRSFAELPLAGLSERALGEVTQDFEDMLKAPRPTDAFWSTRNGGADARDATTHANIPILLTTGYNDYYIGGVFKMWNEMDEQTKQQSALLVSPYNHGDGYDAQNSTGFPMGKRSEQFGSYRLDWLDHVRKGTPIAHPKGVITYYRNFENRWESDFYKKPTEMIKIGLGEKTQSFDYDPLAPTAFACEGCFANDTNNEKGSIRIYTKPFDRDVFIKGQMQAVLTVSSSCADTSFYVRISIKKDEYPYVLRHDITSLSYQLESYLENETVKIKFCFDEHAFLLKKGERLQVDIASTDDNTYVSHTNHIGEYHLQTNTKIATNTVYFGDSHLLLPIEIQN